MIRSAARDEASDELPITTDLVHALLGARLDELDEHHTRTSLARARELGLFPLLYRYLQDRDVTLPALARKQWRAHIAMVTLLRHELLRVNEALAPHLDFIVLKGIPLSETLFGDRYGRDTGDIDILVHLESLDLALELLADAGFHPKEGTRPRPWVNNQLALYHQDTGVVVEVHWRLALPHVFAPSTAEVFLNAQEFQLDTGVCVSVLRPEYLFIHLCYHFHQHVGFLKGLVELAAWIDRFGASADLDEIKRIADRCKVNGMVQWPIQALERVIGYELPFHTRDVDLAVRVWSLITATAATGCLLNDRPTRGYGVLAFKTQDTLQGHKTLWSMLGMLTMDGMRAKATGAGRLIFKGPAVIAAERGQPRPTIGTYVHMLFRPAIMVRKQLLELSNRDST